MWMDMEIGFRRERERADAQEIVREKAKKNILRFFFAWASEDGHGKEREMRACCEKPKKAPTLLLYCFL